MNGKDASNTHWLAKAAGWKGMLIEACPREPCARRGLLLLGQAVSAAAGSIVLPPTTTTTTTAPSPPYHRCCPPPILPTAPLCFTAATETTSPPRADMYAELAASHRTDAICVHAAVCATFRNVHWLSSVNVGGIVEFMSEAHKKEFHPDLKLEEVPMLPCVPLQFILDK